MKCIFIHFGALRIAYIHSVGNLHVNKKISEGSTRHAGGRNMGTRRMLPNEPQPPRGRSGGGCLLWGAPALVEWRGCS